MPMLKIRYIGRLFLLTVLTILLSPLAFPQNRVSAREQFALVIGIKGYPKFYEHERLLYADNDAEKFVEFIQSSQGGAFRADNIFLLRNKEATKERIIKAIDWLSKRVKGDDLVYIFFSGHCVPNSLNQAYFMPFDADPNWPEVLGIRADLLFQDVRSRVNSKYTIYFIDACHSGAALMESGLTARAYQSNAASILNQLWEKEFSNRAAISMAFLSAASNQRSWEDNELKQGIFTYYLLEAMKGGAADRDKDATITASEAYRYLLDKVEDRTALKKKPVQTPMISPTFDHTFPLSKLISPGPIVQPPPSVRRAISNDATPRQRIEYRRIPESAVKAIKESVKRSEAVTYVLFTPWNGWIIMNGSKGHRAFNPREGIDSALRDLNKAGQVVSRIAVQGNEKWIIIKGTKGYMISSGIPEGLTQALDRVNVKQGTIQDVAFSPDGGWVVISDKVTASTTGLPIEFQNAIREVKDLRRVAFAPNGGWVLIEGRSGYKAHNVPPDLVEALSDIKKKNETVAQVTFAPGGGWLVIAH